MRNERPFVIVNPRSGGGGTGRTVSHVLAALAHRLGPVDVKLTEGPGHGISLARDAVAGAGSKLVVAVGGDGTLHEVVNGVLDVGLDGGVSKAAVGYVGQGTGGDFRRTLGLEHRTEAYVEAIASRRERAIDVGRLSYTPTDVALTPSGGPYRRWFVNILSAGIGGLVDLHVLNTTKALGGKAAYFWATARALAKCQRGRLRCDVQLDGVRTQRTLATYMIAICNGRYFGGGMHVAPVAKPDDGRFEVVSIDAPSKLALAAFSRRLYDGHLLSAPGVEHFACDRITIDLDNERARSVFLLDVDGEPLGGLPLGVELVPGVLRLRG